MRKLKTEFDMRYKPKRENYPRGVFGDIDYQEILERYCTYLENKNKALTPVVEKSEQLKAVQKLKYFAYEVCPLHRENDLEKIVNSL